MDIDLGGGLKRIYLVISVIWLITFLFLSWDNLKNKQIETYVINEGPCEELETLYKAMDFRVESKSEDKKMFFLREDGFHTWLPYSEVISNPNRYQLFDNWQGNCAMRYLRPFNERISKLSIGSAVFGLIPIPIYFLIMFIVRGFRKEEK